MNTVFYFLFAFTGWIAAALIAYLWRKDTKAIKYRLLRYCDTALERVFEESNMLRIEGEIDESRIR